MNAPLFSLGQLVATPGALDATKKSRQNILNFVARHQSGDWGELDDEDKAENDLSVKEGFRILSSYTLSTGIKVWVITERDRSATTVLLPEEY